MLPTPLERIDFVLFDVMDTAVRSRDKTAIQPVIDFNAWLKKQGVQTYWTSADTQQGQQALRGIGIDAQVHDLMLLLRQQPAHIKFAAVNDSFLPVMDADAWLDPHDERSGKPFLELKQYKLRTRAPA